LRWCFHNFVKSLLLRYLILNILLSPMTLLIILKIYENPYKNPPVVLKNQNGSRLGYINLHWFFLHPSFIDIDDVSYTSLRSSLLNILQVVGCLKWDFKQNVYHTPIPHITREYWLKSPSSKLISLFLKYNFLLLNPVLSTIKIYLPLSIRIIAGKNLNLILVV